MPSKSRGGVVYSDLIRRQRSASFRCFSALMQDLYLVQFCASPSFSMALRAQRVLRVGHLDMLLNQYQQICHLHLLATAMMMQLDDFSDTLEDAGFQVHPIYAYITHSRTLLHDFI